MCGIAGIIRLDGQPAGQEPVEKMMSVMKHRGPDDRGIYVKDHVALGFVRLSIIDLSPAGHQPMISGDGRYVLIFNGEIYNYLELKEELKGKYDFTTRTDTEVLLASYIVWGEKCLEKFNGMFAFVIYDAQEKRIFGARDRFGIKPFYYVKTDDFFMFASEIPPLLPHLDPEEREIDRRIMYDYMVFNRTDHSEGTFFKKVRKLHHSTSFRIDNNRLSFNRWYDLKQKLGDPFKSVEEYRSCFSSAVGLRLRSDVPVGVCFSGGLDSSGVVSVILKDYGQEELATFSAVFGEDVPTDESKYMNELKPMLKNMYFIKPTARTFLNDINSFVNSHGEPVPSGGPYVHFKVMELAKDNVVVLLDGQGADESLGGYHYFFGYYFRHLLRRFALLRLLSENYHFLRNHRSLMALKSFGYFLLPVSMKSRLSAEKKSYLTGDFLQEYRDNSLITDVLYESGSLQDSLVNHFELKLEHLLKWEDRNSMWFSLEARVPFLDHRLVEKTLSLPPEMILYRGNTKHILREAMKGYLPESIRTRKSKIGFGTPQDRWFREKNLQEYIFDILRSSAFKNLDFIDPQKAEALYRDHLSGRKNAGKDIWKWINLSVWSDMFKIKP